MRTLEQIHTFHIIGPLCRESIGYLLVSTLLDHYAGNPLVTYWFLTPGPEMYNFGAFFMLDWQSFSTNSEVVRKMWTHCNSYISHVLFF